MPVPSQGHYGFHSLHIEYSVCRGVLDTNSFIKVITELPNSEQSYKGKVQTHNYVITLIRTHTFHI
jgi:hypothetical protein